VVDQAEVGPMAKASKRTATKNADGKPRSIQVCNFRSAGRLSNENARALSAIHETFARHLAVTLEDYLGAEIEVKLVGIDQVPINEHITSIPPLSYIVPCSLRSIPCTVIVECDLDIVFPIIERLLGGAGSPANDLRELSEIEEEIMQDVTALIAGQAERTWHIPNTSLEVGQRIKASQLSQCCSPTDKVTTLKFKIDIAGTTGSFQLVLSGSFSNVLINKIRGDQAQPKSRLRYFPMPSIRERILDCDVVVAAGLFPLKVAVRDLIGLQPGCVLKLRAPVQAPGALTLEGRELFEAVPVRNGSQKAAQLGRRAQRTNWEGE
jgi:flagellar motor switch protein FliM